MAMTRAWIGVTVLLVACQEGAVATPADASGDAPASALDATDALDAADAIEVTAPPKNYTLAFRKTLANPAPAALQEGERIFFEETFGTEVRNEFPPAAFVVHLWQADPQKWGKQFANYGFLEDPADDLPIGLKRGTTDPSKVHHTCSTCHTTQLDDGRRWSGMPATRLDWGRFNLDLDAAWQKTGQASLLSEAQRKRFAALQPGSLDVAATGSQDDIAIINDFPMYSELHKMKHLNILGSGLDLRTEVWLSLFGFTDPLPFPDAALTGPLDAYFSWMPAPLPLKPPPAEAVLRGAKVFTQGLCNSCHHVDEPALNDSVDWVDGPELLPGADTKNHPNGTIATDGYFYKSAVGELDGGGGGPGPGLLKLMTFIGDNDLNVTQPSGYVACNLHGLFATAPYLHNGAVPTLEALLAPAKDRPKTFVRHGFTVDTTQPSMSNQGHEFGTQLPAGDKTDLIAYLNSL